MSMDEFYDRYDRYECDPPDVPDPSELPDINDEPFELDDLTEEEKEFASNIAAGICPECQGSGVRCIEAPESEYRETGTRYYDVSCDWCWGKGINPNRA